MFNAGIADCVRRRRDAPGGKVADSSGVFFGSRPERCRGLTVEVRFVEPGSPVVYGSIDEELDGFNGPPAAALPQGSGQRLPVVLIAARHAPRSGSKPQRQLPIGLQGLEEGRRFLAMVHDMAAGKPCAGEVPEERGKPRLALLEGLPGNVALDEFHRRRLNKETSGPSVGVAHHLGGLVKLVPSMDTGHFKRPAVHQR
ncbi:hypothetical protein D3C73_1161050 [compost metagenome]